jgi:hypothetical protein
MVGKYLMEYEFSNDWFEQVARQNWDNILPSLNPKNFSVCDTIPSILFSQSPLAVGNYRILVLPPQRNQLLLNVL